MDMETFSLCLRVLSAIQSFNESVSDLKTTTTEHYLLLCVGTEAFDCRGFGQYRETDNNNNKQNLNTINHTAVCKKFVLEDTQINLFLLSWKHGSFQQRFYI